MLTGALVGLFIGLLIIMFTLANTLADVAKYNMNMLNRMAGNKASFSPDYVGVFIILMFFTVAGALIGKVF